MPTVHQHWQHRNLAMTAMTAATIFANLELSLNAIIWSHDDFLHWYDGIGLCDIEIKVDLMLNILFPAAVSCVLRHLANVMDTTQAVVMQTTAQRRRGYVIDSIFCFVIPALEIPFHYIVQERRIKIVSIGGCQPTSDGSWLAFLLVLLPPLLGVLVAAYYAVLICVRLIKYRRSFNAILANSSTTKSRFFRLYLLCTLVIVGLLPTWAFLVYNNSLPALKPYSWTATHHPTEYAWNSVMFQSSHGNPPFNRYIFLTGGFLMFCFFGFGKDAVRSYRSALLALGFGRIFHSLDPKNTSRCSITTAIESIGSKVKMMMGRKESDMTSTTNTVSTSPTNSCGDSLQKMTFFESIKEERKETRRLRNMAPPMKSKGLGSFTSFLSKSKSSLSCSDDPFIMRNMSNHIHSNISAKPTSPAVASHFGSSSMGGQDVLVQKEFRQASETAETLPRRVYEGVV
ncbi:hypothetical protein DOTSEDRAFT_153817 [Dothistroma septosporum NZE10]|uniref:Uncharacterized protein n=1 Tax=Dothistroma septosporum (strain NZE10 / CBS 128990) TaxID=675120 RepID=M2YN01_DOTSN|nr:hypothetical protein DOTSEDRAFT_153817 [Dothistroma septosporum NZE10]